MTAHMGVWVLLGLLLAAAGDAHHRSTDAIRHASWSTAVQRGSAATPHKGQSSSNTPQLVTLTASDVVTFDFGDDRKLEKELRDSGRYNPKQVLIFDVTVDGSRNRILGVTPLMRRGIPATLSTVPDNEPTNPPMKPYPNMDLHRTTENTITDCNSQLVSVTKTTKTWADDDTLYAIDSGVLDITTSPKNVCPPKIVSFNLRTDMIISSTTIKNAACNSLYRSILVDGCPSGSVTAYSSDAWGHRLTVTDLSIGVSKHLRSQYFYPTPGFFFTKAGGPSVYMPYGLFDASAGDNCDGKLYFQSYASNIQGVLDKQVISDAEDGDVLDITTQLVLPGKLFGPSGPMAVDHDGQRLFFPVQDDLAIYCWNTSKPHDPKNFRMIAQNDKLLQFVSSVKIETATQRLIITSDRFTSYVSNTTNYSEYNIHLLYISIQGLEC